jgi:hypothetical protein
VGGGLLAALPAEAHQHQHRDAERDRQRAQGARQVPLGRSQVGRHDAQSVPHRYPPDNKSPEFRASPLRSGLEQAKITAL